MSDNQQPTPEQFDPEQLTEEQLREAYEAEIKQIRVEQVLLENIVTIINLGMRRTGLMPGTEDEQDAGQVQVAVESVRAQMPLLEAIAPDQAEPLRAALSQLQMAFVQITGGAPAGQPPDLASQPPAPGSPPAPGARPATGTDGPGPAQSSGRLWIPGQ